MSLISRASSVARYHGKPVALLTQHGKERVIAPELEPTLGCSIELVTGFDTDQLGTFTRETSRIGTQIDAARRKARIGMELANTSLGIASEGSFSSDPFIGILPWNVEVLVWIDDELGIEITSFSEGAGNHHHLRSGDWLEVRTFAEKHKFPEQQLVIRPNNDDDPYIIKGLSDWDALQVSFDECLAQSNNKHVFVETDLRAFANPSRMQHIKLAAQNMAQRIQSTCPACHAPGFWITKKQPGLPCAECHAPTASYRSETWFCLCCDYQSTLERSDRLVEDPKYCSYCNP